MISFNPTIIISILVMRKQHLELALDHIPNM